ncbi:hypothetical protein Tco_1282057 [Tanacetum coccineum]
MERAYIVPHMDGKSMLDLELAPTCMINCDLELLEITTFASLLQYHHESCYLVNLVVHDKEFYYELFTPYKEPEREFRSSRRHFKTLKVAESIAETMEQYMSKTRADYGSGVARPKIKDKDNFELKGQFLKELRTNTFSGSDHEDANEHIEKVLEIVDLFHIPNITIDQVMLRAFPISLTRAASTALAKKRTNWFNHNLGWS